MAGRGCAAASCHVVDPDSPLPRKLLELVAEENILLTCCPVDQSEVAGHLLEQSTNGCDPDASGNQGNPVKAASVVGKRAEGALDQHPRAWLHLADVPAEVSQLLDLS